MTYFRDIMQYLFGQVSDIIELTIVRKIQKQGELLMKNKLTVKLVTVILASLMLISSFASCANTADPVNTDAVATTLPSVTEAPTQDSDEVTEAPETDILSHIPELNFNGDTISIMSRDRSIFSDEIYVADENGTIINDAVYKRNLKVSERIGLEIEHMGTSSTNNYEVNNQLETYINSGEKIVDIVSSAAYSTASTTTKGLYGNLRDLPYVDLDRPYWSQGVNEAMQVGGKQYICSGAAFLSYYRFTFVTFFNIDMFNNANIELLYDTVAKNEWTIDKQIELVNQFYVDSNGNGEADEDDVFGFMSNHNMIGVDPYWATCELPILTRNADGYYDYSIDKERTVDVIEKLLKLFWECKGTMRFAKMTDDTEQDKIAQLFAGGKAAMVSLRLIEVENDLLGMDNYGIVPMPKYSSEQPDYHCSIHDSFSVFALPAFDYTEKELEKIGGFLEVFAAESFRTITPAYYEQALKGRYMNDPQSVEMLDIITQNISIDAGVLYSNALEKPQYLIRDTVGGNLTNASSLITQKERIIKRKLEMLNEELEQLVNN